MGVDMTTRQKSGGNEGVGGNCVVLLVSALRLRRADEKQTAEMLLSIAILAVVADALSEEQWRPMSSASMCVPNDEREVAVNVKRFAAHRI